MLVISITVNDWKPLTIPLGFRRRRRLAHLVGTGETAHFKGGLRMSLDEQSICLRLGDKAPDFEATTTHGIVRLSDFSGHWLMLFSHPADFTPV